MPVYLSWNGFEEGSVNRASQAAGTFSVQASVVHTGGFALRVNPTTTGTGGVFMGQLSAANAGWSSSPLNHATVYSQVWFRYATPPGAGAEPVLAYYTSGFSLKLEVRLTSAGQLALYDRAGVLQGTGATVLDPDTWYCLSLRGGNGAAAAYELRIDGVTELSGTCDQMASNVGLVFLGKFPNRSSQSVDLFYDDLAMASDTWPDADAVVRAVVAASAGSSSDWAVGAGSGIVVDERPHDGDTSYIRSAVSLEASSFAVAPVTQITGDIHGLLTMGVVRDESVVSSMRMSVTGATSADFDPGATYLAKGLQSLVNPGTGVAWTPAEVLAVEVGVLNTANAGVRCTLLMAEALLSPDDPVVTSNTGSARLCRACRLKRLPRRF